MSRCGREVAKKILELHREHGLVTYGNLYSSLHQGREFRGQGSLMSVMASLGDVGDYCVTTRTHLINSVVVRKDGSQSPKAQENIYNFGKTKGLVGKKSMGQFINDEIVESLQYDHRRLPPCAGCKGCGP